MGAEQTVSASVRVRIRSPFKRNGESLITEGKSSDPWLSVTWVRDTRPRREPVLKTSRLVTEFDEECHRNYWRIPVN